jgi:hypothetical protein
MCEIGACPSCGTRTDVGDRLCPACLLRLGLQDALDSGAEGAGVEAPRPEDHYLVRAVIDDCAVATAYLAEDSASGQLVRLEVAKAARALAPPGRHADPRVLHEGLTSDGRAWAVTARDAFGRGERGWVLTAAEVPGSLRPQEREGQKAGG